MMKRSPVKWVLFVGFMFVMSFLGAQDADTLDVAAGDKALVAEGTNAGFSPYAWTDSLHLGRQRHEFRAGALVLPAGLLLSGTLIAAVPQWHRGADFPLRDALQADGHSRRQLEDWFQYLPVASVLLLKVCGVQSEHAWRDLLCLGAGTYLVGAVLINSIKYSTRVLRPDGSRYNSFPSGHTFTAFAGAELIRLEYGRRYPGLAVMGYVVASGIGFMRMYNNRHWFSDVLMGAAIGILSARFTYWIAPLLHKKKRQKKEHLQALLNGEGQRW